MKPIAFSDAFPSLRAHVPVIVEVPWQAAFDVASDTMMLPVARMITHLQAVNLGAGIPSMLDFSDSVLRDLAILRTLVEEKRERRAIDFLHFLVCVLPMEQTLIFGDKGTCFDWVVRSVCVDHDPSNRVSTGYAFLPIYETGDSRVGLLCLAELDRWTYTLFTLARTLGGLNELAFRFRAFCWRACCHSFDQSQSQQALSAMGAIATYFDSVGSDDAEPMALDLCALWNNPDFPRRLRGLLGTLLTTGLARFTGQHHSEWAALTLSQYRDVLREHEPLQLLCVATNTPQAWTQRRIEILEEVRRVSRATRAFAETVGTVPILALEARVDIIYPLIHFLASEGMLTDIVDVLAAWYERKEGPHCQDDVLFISPAHGDGVAVVWPTGHSTLIPEAGAESLELLMEDVSNSLGEFYNTAGSKRLPTELNKREGLPVYGNGPALERALEAHYRPRQMFEMIPREFSPSSVIVFPDVPGPIQAVLAQVGIRAPLQASFVIPAPDRPIRVVSLWAGETFLTDFEEQAVVSAGAYHGWQVRCTRPTGDPEADADTFKTFYEDPEPDVIWVVGHGRFVPHEPQKSGIHLDENHVVSIGEIGRCKVHCEGRRLLVLNICNGATAQISGGVARLGLAQEIVGSNQAVVAHLWPIDPIAGLAFGAALASALEGGGHFKAFEKASLLLRDSEDLLQNLEQKIGADHAALERIRYRASDLNNILHWGCPVFLT